MGEAAWQREVRERAYAIWERDGRPEGRAERHRFEAEAGLRGEGRGQSPAAAGRSGEQRPGERLEPRWTEAMVDEADEESFPASDPPAWMP